MNLDHEQESKVMEDGDASLLASVEAKFRILRDRIIGVLEGFTPGLFCVGEGGVGKTHVVMEVLKSQKRDAVLLNSHVTPAGLFRVIKQHSDATILVEDAESLTDGRDRKAWGLLRSALEGQPDGDGKLRRAVTWGTQKPEAVEFVGALLIVANRDLPDCPEVRAIASRIPIIRLEFTPQETAAKMRAIASAGYDFPPHRLSPADCLEVAKFVLDRAPKPNIRVLIQSFRDRLQWSLGASECRWEELVESRIRKEATFTTPPTPKAIQKDVEISLLKEIAHLPSQEQVAMWMERTGKSRASYFRRQKEVAVSPVAAG